MFSLGKLRNDKKCVYFGIFCRKLDPFVLWNSRMDESSPNNVNNGCSNHAMWVRMTQSDWPLEQPHTVVQAAKGGRVK